MQTQDELWMKQALRLAKKAAEKDEVPVGALIVGPEGIVASAFNLRESLQTPLGHAELLAVHKAAKKRNSWRLVDCTLYVTLEPCVMCAGALLQARIPRVVYGASDPKAGAMGSLYEMHQDPRLNHRIDMQGGVLAVECGQLLSDFFKKKRLAKKASRIP